MIRTPGKPEKFEGSAPSVSPTALPEGLFSLCSGGVPASGAFKRLQGKSISAIGVDNGGAISLFQFGLKVVVQRVTGLEIYDLYEILPTTDNFVYDNFGNLVRDNHGIPVLTR